MQFIRLILTYKIQCITSLKGNVDNIGKVKKKQFIRVQYSSPLGPRRRCSLEQETSKN